MHNRNGVWTVRWGLGMVSKSTVPRLLKSAPVCVVGKGGGASSIGSGGMRHDVTGSSPSHAAERRRSRAPSIPPQVHRTDPDGLRRLIDPTKGPYAWPQYSSALPDAFEYRVKCPATVRDDRDKAIVPTSDPETVLGNLQLAAGTLGYSFTNITGFPLLSGLCGAMEPICGEAHDAGNAALLHGTLLKATLMLLATSVPITLLWTRVDVVLLRFGQQPDMAAMDLTLPCPAGVR